MVQVKLVKVLEKYPKLKVAMNWNSANDVESYFNVSIASVWKMLQNNSWKISIKGFYKVFWSWLLCNFLTQLSKFAF